MLSLGQIQQELEAIEELDNAFLKAENKFREEQIAFLIRQCRKEELRNMAVISAVEN